MTPTGIPQNIKKHQILRQAAVPTLDFSMSSTTIAQENM